MATMHSLSDVTVSEDVVLDACGEPDLPELGIIEQIWNTDPISVGKIGGKAGDVVEEFAFDEVHANGSVAIEVGSRGIANLPKIIAGVVERVRELGYTSFIFPAMGSHGGGSQTVNPVPFCRFNRKTKTK